MNKQILFIILLLPLYTTAHTHAAYPADVETVLKKSGKNRSELEKSITWCKKTNDPLKLKAIYFLIANMDIHRSYDYYLADVHEKKVPYNELDYPDFKSSVKAFEELKSKTSGLYAVPIINEDIKTIKGDFLIHNIESAFLAWKSSYAANIPFNDFCEYILPYRVVIEPLQDWRSAYQNKFHWINVLEKSKSINETLSFVATDERSWFSDTWGSIGRNEPLPRLGAMQLLHRKNGKCEDIADLEVFTLRSQGIPAALDIVPYWATAADSHFINTVFDAQMHPIKFDVSRTPAVENELSREPSKVIRITYSKQPGTLASFENANNIPDNFLRMVNYIDVTSQYWQTTNVICPLSQIDPHYKIVYACVFNGSDWRPTWWSKIKNNSATFTSMSKGVVYLPSYYANNKLKPAGYPIAEGYSHELVLKPDLANKKNVIISEENKYLLFQAGKKYKLYYWDNTWRLCGERIAMPNSKTMLFTNVPKNALLILVPEYSIGKERPFMITDDDKRVWW